MNRTLTILANPKISITPTFRVQCRNWSNSTDSRYIVLRNLVLFELNGYVTGVLSGKYRVLWRMELMDEEALCFDASWEVVAEYNGNKNHIFRYQWTRNPESLKPLVGKGWFDWEMGVITVQNDFSTLHLSVDGYNRSLMFSNTTRYVDHCNVRN
jgi:hypothetical protein